MWEWCSDWFDADYYKTFPARDPQGPSGEPRNRCAAVLGTTLPGSRAFSNRYRYLPDDRADSLGFRCVREAIP